MSEQFQMHQKAGPSTHSCKRTKVRHLLSEVLESKSNTEKDPLLNAQTTKFGCTY